MASKVRHFVGTVRCIAPGCGHEVAVTAGGEGGAGAWSLSCPRCGLTAYAKPGTRAHREVSKVVKREEEAEAAAHGLPEKAPAAAPVKHTIFG